MNPLMSGSVLLQFLRCQKYIRNLSYNISLFFFAENYDIANNCYYQSLACPGGTHYWKSEINLQDNP